MLDIHSWLLLIGVCALGAMSPGPSVAVVTRHTLRGSASAGVRAGLAHAAGVGVYAIATVAGLAVILHRFPQLETGIRLAGSVFLLWLAVTSWRSAGQPAPSNQSKANPADHDNPVRDGFLIAFFNPKVMLFFVALFSQFVSANMGLSGRIQVTVTAVVVDGIWYSLVALTLARSPILASLRRHQDKVERITAITLAVVAIAVWF